jgi:hypothetical protein
MTENAAAEQELPAPASAVRDRLLELHNLVDAADFRGYEFDDFLASPFVRALSFDNLLLKRIFIQVGERFPWNVRPLLAIPKLPSTKADGFFARGYLDAYRATGGDWWASQARQRLDRLIETASPGYSGPAWGNAFDFASRGGVIPKGVPTVVWTSHIGEAFLAAWTLLGEERYRDVVIGIGEFVMRDLPRHEDQDGVCLGYTPDALTLVHNSNLLAAVALIRASVLDDDRSKLRLARSAIKWSLRHVNPDGSWFYGVGSRWNWIDNFHTAYVIDCLLEAQAVLGDDDVPDEVLERNIRFWRSHFFDVHGRPCYYHDRLYPLDSQCVAQAIETLSRLSRRDPRSLDQAAALFDWTTRHFRRPDGFYLYRKGRFLTNKLVSIHWSQATMFAAFGTLISELARA